MAYWCRVVKSGSCTDDSWPQDSIMMFWNRIQNWCQTLLKLCWYGNNVVLIIHEMSFSITCTYDTSYFSLLPGQMGKVCKHRQIVWAVPTSEPHDIGQYFEVCLQPQQQLSDREVSTSSYINNTAMSINKWLVSISAFVPVITELCFYAHKHLSILQIWLINLVWLRVEMILVV